MITLDTTKEHKDQLSIFANAKGAVIRNVDAAIKDYEAELESCYSPRSTYRFSEAGKDRIRVLNNYVEELHELLETLHDSYFLDFEVKDPNKHSKQTSLLRKHNLL